MPTMKTVKVTAAGPDGWVVTTKAGQHTALVDQPEAMGGTDTGPSPLDYVFVALGGCIVTIAKIVAGQRRIDLRGMDVEISGDLNLAVLRGQERDDRAGFQNISIKVSVDADMTPAEKKEFLEEVDKRCPVSDNLMNTTPIQIEVAE